MNSIPQIFPNCRLGERVLETIRELKKLGIDCYFEKEDMHSISPDGELSLAAGSTMRAYISKWPHINWLLTVANDGANSIFKALRDNTNGAQDMFLSELVRIMEKYPWCDGIDIDLEKGTPSFRGKEWSTTVIGAIIRQEKYTGCCMLQKYYVEDCISHKMLKNHGELPMFYVEDTHPAIISKETFDRAQQEICTRYGVGMANGTAEKDNLAHRMEGRDYPRRKAYWSEESRRKHAEIYKSRETMKFLHHDFSLFIKCEACGQNLTGQFRTFADGTRELRWTCGKHNKVPHDTPDTRPRPPHMRDAILKRMVTDVLGMENFDAQAMCQALSHISALGDILTFHFLDGREEKRRYIPGKRGYRRREGMKCREEG